MNALSTFPIWKTITIGTHQDVPALKKDILSAGFHIGSWANDILENSNVILAPNEKKIHLAKITPRDLGYLEGAYRPDIYKKACERGLSLCPLEVGPQLRLQYFDQPKLESLQIGMEPQTDSTGHESEFRVVHGGDGFLWLVGDHKHPDDFWRADEHFIFISDVERAK